MGTPDMVRVLEAFGRRAQRDGTERGWAVQCGRRVHDRCLQ